MASRPGFGGTDVAACPQLSKVDRRRVFGLLVDPEVLVQYRKARSRRLGTVANGYDDASVIYEEVEQVKVSCALCLDPSP